MTNKQFVKAWKVLLDTTPEFRSVLQVMWYAIGDPAKKFACHIFKLSYAAGYAAGMKAGKGAKT